jgi:uncharacterized protein (DUF2141 family)
MRQLTYILFIVAALASCARMGQPDGGWYDDIPPHVVSSSPADKAVGVKSRKVVINFNEYIKLEDAQNKVIVSPPQLEVPDIKAAGKRIIVTLKDSLKENTTYTIDFSDAISDNSEGNPMGNYTYSFSTGSEIDTLEVSGYVLDAKNLEPIKGILVGLYDNLSDTIVRREPMVRISRTDSRGRFVIKGVAPGQYRCYALQDADGDFLYNQMSEKIGFLHDVFEPFCRPDTRPDTIWRDSLHIDNIVSVPYTHFFPDDITLLAFQPVQSDRYLLKTERSLPEKLGIYFSYGNDSLPLLRGLNYKSEDAFVVEPSEHRDTIFYWLRDTMLVNQDTLRTELTYMMTDTLGALVCQTDTVEFLAKQPYEKRLKERQQEFEKWQKEQEKKKKHEEPYDTVMAPKPLRLSLTGGPSLDPDQKIYFETPVPLARLDTAAIHLYSMIDSVWYEADFRVKPDRLLQRRVVIEANWRPGVEYSLEVDSAAFESIYGLVSDPFKEGLRVRSLDEYATLLVTLSGVSDSADVCVQLLEASDEPKRQTKADGGQAEFYYVTPGKYYLRAFVDLNGNGLWDTGDYDRDLQAEPVYYYTEALELKAKWDRTVTWNLTSKPRYRQKPLAITKQKPDKEKKLRSRNAERARKLGIEYVRKTTGVNL